MPMFVTKFVNSHWGWRRMVCYVFWNKLTRFDSQERIENVDAKIIVVMLERVHGKISDG